MATTPSIPPLQSALPVYQQQQKPAQAAPAPQPAATGKDTIAISPQARVMTMNLQGMTVDEIAHSLGITVKTVESYLSLKTES